MLTLAMPLVLLLLPLPILIWLLLPSSAIKISAALRIPFFNRIATIMASAQNNFNQYRQFILLMLIWCLAIIAAAGPRWIGDPLSVPREGHNIMLVLDLSGSMELTDLQINGRPVSRLTIVKKAAKQFVADRLGDRMGLILFGTRAYLQTPLTFDRQTVLMRIDDATVGLAGQTTSLGDALGLAVKHFQGLPLPGRVVILLTDGASNSGVLTPDVAANLAKTDNIKVYTIGLGREANLNFGLPFNGYPGADLDEGTLQNIANITGGQYFRATDLSSLHIIYATINKLERLTQEHPPIRPEHDYYPWPLGLAFLLLLYWLAMHINKSQVNSS